MSIENMAGILSLLLKIFSLWFLLTALLFWKRPPKFKEANPKNRFCLLVPARNEAAVIGDTVASMWKLDYPNDLYDIWVLPNNCSDDTEAIARASGANIISMTGTGFKGEVLNRAIDRLMPCGYDAFCVFDADNLLNPQFLRRMNDAIEGGARVAKARLKTKNTYDSWVAGCYGLYFGIFDTFFNRSRAGLGMSAKLVGTGFMVHREVLERIGGWHTETIAEDAEFSAELAELGERVYWVPDAITYDESPLRFRVSLSQRHRWISGIMSVARCKLGGLFRNLMGLAVQWAGGEADLIPQEVDRFRVARLIDSIMFLCLPFAQVLSMIPMAVMIIGAIIRGLWMYLFIVGICWYLGFAIFGLALAMVNGYRDRRIIKSVLGFPLFMASWGPIQIASLLAPVMAWQPISHGIMGRAEPIKQKNHVCPIRWGN